MTKQPQLLRVHHAQITIPKETEDTAREFYCGLLGLEEVPKPESLRGRGGFWLQIGAFQVHVGTEDDFDRTQTKAHVAYEVEGSRGLARKAGCERDRFSTASRSPATTVSNFETHSETVSSSWNYRSKRR